MVYHNEVERCRISGLGARNGGWTAVKKNLIFETSLKLILENPLKTFRAVHCWFTGVKFGRCQDGLRRMEAT
jgi:hypothetical protein